MKNQVAAAALMAAIGAYARKPHGHGGQQLSTTTVTYDDCPSMPSETMITVTSGVTVTYCPKCEMTSAGVGYTTVYTTTYMSLCPTGMVPATYTVTESCPEPTPTWTPGASHIPQGFTVTQKECTVCGQATPTVTVTEPCGCEAHNGTPGPPAPQTPAPTPTGGSSPPASPPAGNGAPPSEGSSPPSEECSEYKDGQPQCSSASAAPVAGSKPGSGAPPYPTPTPTGETCSGAECRTSTATGAPLLPGSGSGTSPPVSGSKENSAPSVNSLLAYSSSAMAVIVAALAFIL